MKVFTEPTIKVVVTSDGPACFDISGEFKQLGKEEIFKGLISACNNECVVPCGCIVPCDCICLCICECMCEDKWPDVCGCQCTCECQDEYGSVCPAESAITHDPMISIVYPISSKMRIVKFNDAYMLRKEKFGGLIFDKQTFNTYLCNETAFDILNYIKENKGINIKAIIKICDNIKDKYQNIPENLNDIVYSFIHGCLKDLSKKA